MSTLHARINGIAYWSQGLDSWQAGYLPYSIIDQHQQLTKDFAYWRAVKAAAALDIALMNSSTVGSSWLSRRQAQKLPAGVPHAARSRRSRRRE